MKDDEAGLLVWLRRRAGTLLIALMLGLAAAVAVQRHLEASLAAQARALAPPPPAPKPETRTVVVPVESLAAGTRLSASMLAHREVPQTFLHASSIPADDFERLIGRELVVDVEGGRPLLEAQIGSERVARLSEVLEPGRRAVTVAVDVENGIGGFLTPDDLIDIDMIVDDTGTLAARSIARRVRILAAGPHVASSVTSDDTVPTTYATLTLDVTPRDARRIALAARNGRLLATLRHPGDTGSNEVSEVALQSERSDVRSAPLATSANPSDPRPSAARSIEFIIGGRS